MAAWKAKAALPDDDAVCECGSGWFQPQRRTEGGETRFGAVRLTRGGAVVGYAGVMVCMECGREAAAPLT